MSYSASQGQWLYSPISNPCPTKNDSFLISQNIYTGYVGLILKPQSIQSDAQNFKDAEAYVPLMARKHWRDIEDTQECGLRGQTTADKHR